MSSQQASKSNGQRFHRVALMLLVFLAFTMPCLAANNYYVATNGVDSNPGSESKAWRTIAQAANNMSPGDTVTVLAGNYAAERVAVTKSGMADAPIIYQARGTVVMKGFQITANHITIRGFEIADTDYARWHSDISAGVHVKGHHVIVESNYVHDATLDGIVLFGTPAEPTVTSNCVVRGNRLFRNAMSGITVSGRNNLIEGNEIWGTVQYHPQVLAAEGFPAKIGGLDADGMRFFGQGHVFRKNHVHDIRFGNPGINLATGDYNDNPHIDCFQTWTDQYNETAQNIVFEQNHFDNADAQSPNETSQGIMMEGGPQNILVRNNIFKSFRGVNAIDCHNLVIVNNTFIGDLALNPKQHPFGVGLRDCKNPTIKNNLFYDMPGHAINVVNSGEKTGQDTVLAYVAKNMVYRSDGKPVWEPYTYAHTNDFWNIDPRLVNAAKGNYHLRSDSPAIGAGVALKEVPLDFDGAPRPQQKGLSIGAFEYRTNPK